MEPLDAILFPPPATVRRTAGSLALGSAVRLEGDALPRAARETLERALAACGMRLGAGGARVRAVLDPSVPGGPEASRLRVDAAGVLLAAAAPAGLFRAAHVLARLLRAAATTRELPCLEIDDRPVFAERGVMLDVSRDRVPTMETLLELVELFASLGLNRLELYTEHTFAYRGHEEVWRGADPLTPDEIRALDARCAELFVELVPNQQSFGHLHRWLVHDRYRPLAECPDGVEHPFSPDREPFSLCPTDPRSLALLGELYDQLLPCFRSRRLNVGLDETFDLGRGRSRAAVERQGVGRVYLDFLRAVERLVAERGHRTEFWADIVLDHPELVPELPAGARPLLWGYEADHPFAEQARRLAEAGLSFAVCPGTQSWQSLGGRTGTLLANVAAAARHGAAHGASGLVVTDWGDRGHLQPLPVSLPGWILAAGLAWNPAAAERLTRREGLAPVLDRLLGDAEGGLGAGLLALGDAGERTGARARNASPLSLLLTAWDRGFPTPGVEGLTAQGLERAGAHLVACREGLARLSRALAAPAAEARLPGAGLLDAGLVTRELELAAGLAAFGTRLGRARLEAPPGTPLEELAAPRRAALAGELAPLAAAHRALWPARSRPGGLERSAGWLERPLAALARRPSGRRKGA